MVIEATGKAGTSIKPDGKGGIGQGFTVWQGKPITVSTTGKAPRSGESLPTVKATGLARGILPLGGLAGR